MSPSQKKFPARYCEYCGERIVPSQHESITRFKERRFCSSKCSGANQRMTCSGSRRKDYIENNNGVMRYRGTMIEITPVEVLNLRFETRILGEMGLMA